MNVGTKTKEICIKYWIYVCALIILLVAIRQPVVSYSIIYMALFSVLIAVLLVIDYKYFPQRYYHIFLLIGFLPRLEVDTFCLLANIGRIFCAGARFVVYLSIRWSSGMVGSNNEHI